MEILIQLLKRPGSKTCHLLCGELIIVEEYLYKCMAHFLEALSPCLEGTNRTKAFVGPQVRQSFYNRAQSHLWLSKLKSYLCLQQPIAGKKIVSESLILVWRKMMLLSHCMSSVHAKFCRVPEAAETSFTPREARGVLEASTPTSQHQLQLQAFLCLGRVYLWKSSWRLSGKFLLSFYESPRGQYLENTSADFHSVSKDTSLPQKTSTHHTHGTASRLELPAVLKWKSQKSGTSA